MASIYDKPDFRKLVMMSEIDALRHNIDYNIILIRAFHAIRTIGSAGFPYSSHLYYGKRVVTRELT